MTSIVYIGYELFGRTKGPWAAEVRRPAPDARRWSTKRQWRLDGDTWVRLPDGDGVWHRLLTEVGYDEIPAPNLPLPPEMIAEA